MEKSASLPRLSPNHRRAFAFCHELDFDRIHNAITLIYKQPPTEMHVIFTGDKVLPLLFREHLENKIYPFVPHDGLVEMGCVKK